MRELQDQKLAILATLSESRVVKAQSDHKISELKRQRKLLVSELRKSKAQVRKPHGHHCAAL
jgi:hypothetical protein